MSDNVVNVIEDLDSLIKSLTALRNELTTGSILPKIKVISIPIPSEDEKLIEDIRKMLIELEPNFGEICEVRVGVIGNKYREQTGQDVKDQKIGRVMRKLGLQARRTRIGFLARWKKGSLGDGRTG